MKERVTHYLDPTERAKRLERYAAHVASGGDSGNGRKVAA